MNTESILDKNKTNNPAFGHAVVIGSSIAGLTAARVLSDHFAKVTIIERDRLSNASDFRRGVPQARHVHILRLRGQRILEQLFPGLVDELLVNGAVTVNAGNEAEFFLFGDWRGPRYESNIVSISASRPLLENTIYRRLVANPRINVLSEHEVLGVMVDALGKQVAGIRLRNRHDANAGEIELAADLVVDASGRNSQAPHWLADLGFTPPEETVVNAFPGYTTRLYQRPAGFQASWKTMYIIPTPPNSPRGAVIAPLEGGRWVVTLIGLGGDYPPTDEQGFMEFARSLPSRRIYDAIKDAEPLTKPYGFQQNENRLRHYDQLPRYLEGFLVLGDAVYTLNPTHAQGMTVAAMGSLALGRCLQAQRQHHGADLTGLARAFQQELREVINGPWHMAVSTDRRWPTTAGADQQPSLVTRLKQKYFTWVLRAMVHDPEVAEAFFHVQHMVAPPTTLFRREIMIPVLCSGLGLGRRRQQPAVQSLAPIPC